MQQSRGQAFRRSQVPCSAAAATIASRRASAPSTPAGVRPRARAGVRAEADVHRQRPRDAVEPRDPVGVERLAVVRHQERAQALAHVERAGQVGVGHGISRASIRSRSASQSRSASGLASSSSVGRVLVDLGAVHEPLNEPQRLWSRLLGTRFAMSLRSYPGISREAPLIPAISAASALIGGISIHNFLSMLAGDKLTNQVGMTVTSHERTHGGTMMSGGRDQACSAITQKLSDRHRPSATWRCSTAAPPPRAMRCWPSWTASSAWPWAVPTARAVADPFHLTRRPREARARPGGPGAPARAGVTAWLARLAPAIRGEARA